MPRPAPKPRNAAQAERAALRLASGLSFKAVAAELGVNERTLRRWAENPDFRARVEEIKAELTGRTINMLTSCSSAAVAELARLMTRSANDSVRLGAARAILDKFPLIHEHFELTERIRALERRAEEQERRR